MDATDTTISQPQQSDSQNDLQNQNPSETLIQDIQNQSDKEDTTTITMILTDKDPPPKHVLCSPINRKNRHNKRKNRYNPNKPSKKFQTLTTHIKPIPFTPTKLLDFEKHQDVLHRLGLLEFSKLQFDTAIRTDLIAQLILNFDIKKKCSYVNGYRINVSRALLARALKLPLVKQDKSVDEVDLDSEVFSDEAIGFIEDFVFNWMLLHEESWVMPTEIQNWTRCIRDGHPEKLDSASLIWYKVEKELAQGDKLTYCYYASHLQELIRFQRKVLFPEDDDNTTVVADCCDESDEEREEKQENVSVFEEPDLELTLGQDVEETVNDEVKKDDEVMVDDEECKAEEEVVEKEMEVTAEEDVEAVTVKQGNLALNLKNNLDEHFLQRCQSSDLNNYEEKKVEEVGDEQIEQVDDGNDEEEEEEEEEVGERGDEEVGYDMDANDDSLDRDGMTANFFQRVETSHIPYNNSHGISSADLFQSRDGSFMSNGGPSSFFNNGKRLLEPEEEEMHQLDGNNKRLKTDQIWDQKQNEFSFCMEQMQHLMEKAKMIHESKEQNYENLQYNQQSEINQLRERHNLLEMIIKSKDEELGKQHTEVFRLERELYLMSDLLNGYRKALNDTRFKFSEYRKRYALKEEPLYKDAGPGGLVLSTREIEKQRLKQEEDIMKISLMAKNLEDQFVYQFKMHDDKVLLMADRLASIGAEVTRLKEIAKQCKETQKPLDEVDLSVKPEENQKSVDENDIPGEPEENQKSLVDNESSVEPEMNQKLVDEQDVCAEPEENQKDEQAVVVENDDANTMESVPLDADESKEKGGDKDCMEEE